MLKCWTCQYQESIRKSNLTPGGSQNYVITCTNQNYVISCRDEKISFEAAHNEHDINLPCRGNVEELKSLKVEDLKIGLKFLYYDKEKEIREIREIETIIADMCLIRYSTSRDGYLFVMSFEPKYLDNDNCLVNCYHHLPGNKMLNGLIYHYNKRLCKLSERYVDMVSIYLIEEFLEDLKELKDNLKKG